MKNWLLALLLLVAVPAGAANLGDYDAGTVIYGKFTTYQPSTGAAFALAGTPALSVYKDNSTTQSTTGVTLTASFDSVTGLNHFAIDTSADGTFYSAGSNFDIVITTGTVDSVSVVGSVVGSFTIRKDSGLKPATAGRTVVIDAAGLADANTVKLGPSGSGTAQTARDIGASVLLSSGTGTGQLSITSGIASVNVTQYGGSAGTFASGIPSVNVAQVSGDATAADTFETWLDGTAGPASPLGIARQGTAQSATGTTIVLDSAASFADDTTIGMTVVACGSTQGYCQSRVVTDYVGSTDTATVETWNVTPSGTITYYLFSTAPSSGGSGLDAAGVRAAIGLASANLDTQLSTIDDYVDTEVAAIKTKTDFLPSATAGASGGLFIAGTNAATTVTTSFTTTFTGNLTGSVGSVTGAVGSVTGAVGSVTGNVGGNVTGSVGSVASGGISEASFATTAGSMYPLNIVDQGTAQAATGTTIRLRAAAAFADDELIGARVLVTGGSTGVGQSALITDYVSSTDTATVTWPVTTPTGTITYKVFSDTAASSSGGLDAAGVRAAVGLASANLDTQLSGIQSDTDNLQTRIPAALVSGRIDASVGAMATDVVTAAAIAADAIGSSELAATATAEQADAVWDEARTGHTTAGTFGFYLDSSISGVSTGGVSAGDIADAVWDEALAGHSTAGTAGKAITDHGTQLTGIQADTDDIQTRIPAALVSGRIDASVGAMASNTMTAAAAAADLSTELQSGLATSSALSSLATQVGTAGNGLTAIPWNSAWDVEVQSEATDALNALTLSEPAAVPNWSTSTLAQWIAWIGAWTRNEVQQSSTTKTLRNDADNANIATCAVSDNGTTFQVSECQ